MQQSQVFDCPAIALGSRIKEWLKENQSVVIDRESIRQNVYMNGSTAMALYSFLYTDPNEARQM